MAEGGAGLGRRPIRVPEEGSVAECDVDLVPCDVECVQPPSKKELKPHREYVVHGKSALIHLLQQVDASNIRVDYPRKEVAVEAMRNRLKKFDEAVVASLAPGPRRRT